MADIEVRISCVNYFRSKRRNILSALVKWLDVLMKSLWIVRFREKIWMNSEYWDLLPKFEQWVDFTQLHNVILCYGIEWILMIWIKGS